jgi:DNA-binding MarR family transcriptional regulator
VSDIKMNRQELDGLLFNALTAIYAFERDKVKRFELSYGQIYLLQLLRRQSPSRMSEIACRMGMPISTMTRIVAKMERMQLLERVTDEKDRRAILVSLTDNGEKTVRAVEDHSFSVLSTRTSTTFPKMSLMRLLRLRDAWTRFSARGLKM